MRFARLTIWAVLALLVAPLATEAQPAAKVPRIGVLLGGSPGDSRLPEAFRQGLRGRERADRPE